MPDGAAQRAGVLSGDVVVAFAGEPVGTVDDLHRLLTAERAGRPVPLTLLRRTDRRDIVITPREVGAAG